MGYHRVHPAAVRRELSRDHRWQSSISDPTNRDIGIGDDDIGALRGSAEYRRR